MELLPEEARRISWLSTEVKLTAFLETRTSVQGSLWKSEGWGKKNTTDNIKLRQGTGLLR
jgi:hypothetical protein